MDMVKFSVTKSESIALFEVRKVSKKKEIEGTTY